MTTAAEVCNREVVVTSRDTTVASAARLMRDHHVGTLVVTEAAGAVERPVGIVTDRDLVVEIMALDIDANDMTVGEIMAPSLVIAHGDEDIREVLERMRHKAVRRMPVVSARGHLIGIVAVDDLLKVLAADIAALAVIAAREQSRETAQRKPISI